MSRKKIRRIAPREGATIRARPTEAREVVDKAERDQDLLNKLVPQYERCSCADGCNNCGGRVDVPTGWVHLVLNGVQTAQYHFGPDLWLEFTVSGGAMTLWRRHKREINLGFGIANAHGGNLILKTAKPNSMATAIAKAVAEEEERLALASEVAAAERKAGWDPNP